MLLYRAHELVLAYARELLVVISIPSSLAGLAFTRHDVEDVAKDEIAFQVLEATDGQVTASFDPNFMACGRAKDSLPRLGR